MSLEDVVKEYHAVSVTESDRLKEHISLLEKDRVFLSDQIEELRLRLARDETARLLLLSGMESQADLMDGLKQTVRTQAAEIAKLKEELSAASVRVVDALWEAEELKKDKLASLDSCNFSNTGEDLKKGGGPVVYVGADGLCLCSQVDLCLLGRTGSALRCSQSELERANVVVLPLILGG